MVRNPSPQRLGSINSFLVVSHLIRQTHASQVWGQFMIQGRISDSIGKLRAGNGVPFFGGVLLSNLGSPSSLTSIPVGPAAGALTPLP